MKININPNSIIIGLILLVLTLIGFLIFTNYKNNKLNNININQIKNNILLEELHKQNDTIEHKIKYYMKKDGVINNNYKTYIQQYEKEVKIFDTTKFTNPELDSLFTNWKPE